MCGRSRRQRSRARRLEHPQAPRHGRPGCPLRRPPPPSPRADLRQEQDRAAQLPHAGACVHNALGPEHCVHRVWPGLSSAFAGPAGTVCRQRRGAAAAFFCLGRGVLAARSFVGREPACACTRKAPSSAVCASPVQEPEGGWRARAQALSAVLIGKRVWIRWPYLVEGIVTAICCSAGRVSASVGLPGGVQG